MQKIVQYRNKCIGCGVCAEQQPELWHMSKKDGKATLLRAVKKKGIFILPISNSAHQKTLEVIRACPVKSIKIS